MKGGVHGGASKSFTLLEKSEPLEDSRQKIGWGALKYPQLLNSFNSRHFLRLEHLQVYQMRKNRVRPRGNHSNDDFSYENRTLRRQK